MAGGLSLAGLKYAIKGRKNQEHELGYVSIAFISQPHAHRQDKIQPFLPPATASTCPPPFICFSTKPRFPPTGSVAMSGTQNNKRQRTISSLQDTPAGKKPKIDSGANAQGTNHGQNTSISSANIVSVVSTPTFYPSSRSGLAGTGCHTPTRLLRLIVLTS